MPAINRTFSRNHIHSSIKPFHSSISSHHLTTTTHVLHSSISSRHLATTTHLLHSSHRHSSFQSQNSSYTSSYETGRPTQGPLSGAPLHGAPRLTPSTLKAHLDKYVVGQDKAKKMTSVAIYNHYQRIRELRRLEEEEEERREQRARWEMRERERNAHPVENEYPGHVETVDLNAHLGNHLDEEPDFGTKSLDDGIPHTVIEKSNLMLLGPSGVGKTYILSTLARILEVPFATIDCSSLTQAGYIGTDIESSLERLLLASSFSLSACQRGIIFFDEVDKLAKPAVMMHGRDVSGEGVQQGLLKMIEGTTVTVTAKSDRSVKGEREERGGRDGGRGGMGGGKGGEGKGEQYTIDTSNILFVFAGAFVGLERIIASRLSSGSSLGFGAQLKSRPPPSSSSSPTTKSESKLKREKKTPNPLQHVLPSDLQAYGLIPELLGRIPLLCSLTPLGLADLVSILTSPRNSLVAQYTALFSTYGITLKFTTAALHAIASQALSSSTSKSGGKAEGGGIGARGLRGIMEKVLAEVMFVGPGSAVRYCLVDDEFVRSCFPPTSSSSSGERDEGDEEETQMPRCWSRGQSRVFEDEFEKAEEQWRVLHEEGERQGGGGDGGEGGLEKLRRVGSSGM